MQISQQQLISILLTGLIAHDYPFYVSSTNGGLANNDGNQ